MVSMADEGGELVLMGVDATYCIVDEVDTTTSTLQDIFLQEAFHNTGTHSSMDGCNSGAAMDSPHEHTLQEVIHTSAKNAVKAADKMLNKRKRKRKRKPTDKNCEQDVVKAARGDIEKGIMEGDGDTVIVQTTESGSALLRAALLGKPVSLREPGLPGKLSFCLQRSGSPEDLERQRRGDSPPESESSTADSHTDGQQLQDSHLSISETEQEASEGTDEVKSKEKAAKKPRSREKHYQCGVCKRLFGCKSHVVEHMRTHTGEKPYKCPLCDRSFSQKSNIYQHMNTHTLQRPFRCDDCGKDFMYRGSLYKHKRLHTGERPYCCGVCSWRFTHASQLFEHMRTHTNEKPFKCGVCGRAFAHSGTMHRHQRNHFSHLVPKQEETSTAGEDEEKSELNKQGNENDSAGKNLSSATPAETEENAKSRASEVLLREKPEAMGTCGKITFAAATESEPSPDVAVDGESGDTPHDQDSGSHKIFSCELCGKDFAHKRSVRRHKLNRHGKKSADISGTSAPSMLPVLPEPVQSSTVSSELSSSNKDRQQSVSNSSCDDSSTQPEDSSVIRLLLSHKPADDSITEASFLSKLIFGKCQPPTMHGVINPSFVAVPEQNNNGVPPALLKQLLAVTAARGRDPDDVSSRLCKEEPGDETETPRVTSLPQVQEIDLTRVKQEPVDS